MQHHDLTFHPSRLPVVWVNLLMARLLPNCLLSPNFTWLARASHPGKQREQVEDLDWELALR
jgi:hypothetical protein